MHEMASTLSVPDEVTLGAKKHGEALFDKSHKEGSVKVTLTFDGKFQATCPDVPSPTPESSKYLLARLPCMRYGTARSL